MKPAPFEYYAPTSVEEAIDHLARLGYSGKVLAGGQSLVPAMNFRMARPSALVDLNPVTELFYIRPNEDGGLSIGAMTRKSKVEHDPLVAERAPLVVEAMPFIAHPQIRNRGTFGGSIAHADPAGQLPGISLALNARFRIRGKAGERWSTAEEFFLGPFMTVIEADEILVEVVLPPLPKRSGTSYKQVSRQRGSTIQAAVASVITLDEKDRCTQVRVAMLAVGETPLLSQQAAKLLVGQVPTAEAIQAVAEAASQTEIDPGSDMHASATYRRNLINVLVRRSLTEAFDRARQKGG